MNWNAISFDWNQVRAVLATAEAGSFSGAARALGTTQPTIGRQVTGLEEALGVTLFERSVRGPVLTEAGQRLIDHLRAMGEAAVLISMAADQTQELSGEVTITASDLMASAILPPILLRLQQAAPAIRLRINTASEIKDLGQREADIAIRHVRPEQPAMIARHIGDFRANFYAAKSYLERTGRPRSVVDLTSHRFVANTDIQRLIAILARQGANLAARNFAIATNGGPAAWEMVRAGLGIGLFPEHLGEAEPGLEKALPALPSVAFPVWLVTHRELRTTARIRFVFDALARGLGRARGS